MSTSPTLPPPLPPPSDYLNFKRDRLPPHPTSDFYVCPKCGASEGHIKDGPCGHCIRLKHKTASLQRTRSESALTDRKKMAQRERKEEEESKRRLEEYYRGGH